MRIQSSVTAISWIPSEAVEGLTRLPFSVGVAHYDDPPPDRLDGPSISAAIEELRLAGRFRIAHHLAGWIDVEAGEVRAHGQSGGGIVGDTRLSLTRSFSVAAAAYTDLRPEPEVGADYVRFRQTAGGRTGVPAPRHVRHPPFVQVLAPTAWTSLELTIRADGSSEVGLPGASPFPRHWVYDAAGELVLKSGMTRFKEWYRHAFGRHSPWGEEDSPALTSEVETALERRLSTTIMRRGRKPAIRTVKAGDTVVLQGEPGVELYLLLDGIVGVDHDAVRLTELGPGAIVGERALLEAGRRTATLVAVTDCKLAVAVADDLDPAVLLELRDGHRREEHDHPR